MYVHACMQVSAASHSAEPEHAYASNITVIYGACASAILENMWVHMHSGMYACTHVICKRACPIHQCTRIYVHIHVCMYVCTVAVALTCWIVQGGLPIHADTKPTYIHTFDLLKANSDELLHVYVHVCIHTCVYTYMCVYIHTCMYTYMYVCTITTLTCWNLTWRIWFVYISPLFSVSIQ